MQGFLIMGIIFALLIAIFSIQNAVPVSLSFFSWHFDTSLVVVILGAVALGALIMGIFSYVKQFRLKRKVNKLQKSNKELKKVNKDLSDQLARNHDTKYDTDNGKQDKDNKKANHNTDLGEE